MISALHHDHSQVTVAVIDALERIQREKDDVDNPTSHIKTTISGIDIQGAPINSSPCNLLPITHQLFKLVL